METTPSGEWYYCLEHRRVERGPGCRDEVRLGPYPTERAAALALETVERRNLEWDRDPAWTEDE
jgi:hypothetical protein